MSKVIITTFTDPMMGLSYEREPVFRKLETHFREKIAFRYVMAGLVRDVSDFMTPEELAMEPEEGIKAYCARLAEIYKSEEYIGGLPIHMDGFHLFDSTHRSSWPLDIAFKAAALTAPEKAERFLYNLRYATIVETRQTTRTDELLRVAEETGIDKGPFLEAFQNGAAEAAFLEDLRDTRSLGIRGLPAYLIEYEDKALLVRSPGEYETFTALIDRITEGWIKPQSPNMTTSELEDFFRKHPLISEMELMAAFNLKESELPDRIREIGRLSFSPKIFRDRQLPV